MNSWIRNLVWGSGWRFVGPTLISMPQLYVFRRMFTERFKTDAVNQFDSRQEHTCVANGTNIKLDCSRLKSFREGL